MNDKSSGKESLYLGYLINFDWLISNYVEPLKLTEKDFAWILDDEGRLIYHPNHEEMLFRRIDDFDKSCQECHTSFDIQKQMLIRKSSIDEEIVYTISCNKVVCINFSSSRYLNPKMTPCNLNVFNISGASNG